MIKDRLEYAERYYNILDKLKIGFDWLKNSDLKSMESKKYIIDGENLYANLQDYDTKLEADYEVHRKYIDIQYMIEGEENIGIATKSDCTTCVEYNSKTDLEFMKKTGKEEFIKLTSGDFVVFFPQDAHKPSMSIDNNIKHVKKVIVKVAI